MRIAIYSRKSKFTGKGESIGNQVEMCRDYIATNYNGEEHSIQVFEDEGFSGKNLDRPQLKKMMEIENVIPFDLIVVYRLDRISRNVGDFASLIEKLNKKNTSFVCVKEHFDTGNSMGRAMMNIAAVFAQLERETIAERIKDNMYLLAKEGHWLGGTTPLGYKSIEVTNGKRTHFELIIDESQIDLVNIIFSKYKQLGSINGVETYLFVNGYKTQKNNYWHKSNVKRILTNPIYCIADIDSLNYFTELGCNVCFTLDDCNGKKGIYPYNRFSGQKREMQSYDRWIVTISEHQGILAGKEWVAIQQQLKANSKDGFGGKANERRSTSNTSLLSGVLFCSCGAYMRPKKYPSGNTFYICENKMDKKITECNNSNINADELDKIILNELFSFDIKDGVVDSQIQNLKEQVANIDNDLQKQIGRLKKQIETNKNTVNKFMNIVALSIENDTSEQVVEVYNQKINELLNQNKITQKRIDELQDTNIVQAKMNDRLNSLTDAMAYLKENFDKLTIVEKRGFVKEIVDRIVLDGNNINIFIKGISELSE